MRILQGRFWRLIWERGSPVPHKLVERIQKGEFIEMCEYLPEFWIAPREGEDMAGMKTCSQEQG